MQNHPYSIAPNLKANIGKRVVHSYIDQNSSGGSSANSLNTSQFSKRDAFVILNPFSCFRRTREDRDDDYLNADVSTNLMANLQLAHLDPEFPDEANKIKSDFASVRRGNPHPESDEDHE